MRDFTDIYDKAGRQLFDAYREAFQTVAPAELPEPPPIDDLWKQTTVSQVNELAKRVGPGTVAKWLAYMKKKGGGQW